MAWDVVIAGGGFGGFYAARRLERVLPPQSARVTLITDVNYLLYTPLLPGAAAGTLEPRHVVIPLREELSRTHVMLARLTAADPAKRTVRVTSADGRDEDLSYDQLVLALGSIPRTAPVPGLGEHALGFNTLPSAVELRNRTLRNLEIAESLDDPEARRSYLTFVFVGAGYAGVEGIAELQDYVADVIVRYPRSRIDGTRWVLVELQDRIMPEISPALAEFAQGELRARGIEVRTGTGLQSIDDERAVLSDGESIPTRLLCWTAGVRPPALTRELGLPVDHSGRIVVDSTMVVEGHPGVWAIGDCAAVPDPAKGGRAPSPPTAQHALRQGRRVAENVAASIGHGRIRKFRYKTKGVFVDMGRHKAVAELMGIKLSGFLAWWTARTYHLAMMPGAGRRLRLVADWTVGLFFGRASAELGQLGHPEPLGDGRESAVAARTSVEEPASPSTSAGA